ncbi:hypothetical protein EVA_14243, partial [gut metagenome]
IEIDQFSIIQIEQESKWDL